VLTDATGNATCNPILSGSGSGQFSVLVGGVAASAATGQPLGYLTSTNISLSVTAPAPDAIQVISGNNQSATAGQSVPSPLVAVVQSKGNSVASQTVTWSVSPSGAGTLINTSLSSDQNGRVQTGLLLSSSASGTITVTVSVPNTNVRFSFSVNAVPLVSLSSLQKIPGGDGQSVASGQVFPNPLVVAVTNTNGQPATGVTVNFGVNGGPVSLSTAAPVTNSAGQAQVTATALSVTSQTQVTVTASIGGMSQTFTLTVIPPGPAITSNGFVNAADQKLGSLSPCSLATAVGSGLIPNIQGTLVGAAFGPGPISLSGTSITFPNNPGGDQSAPIFSANNSNGQQSVTFQVPCSTPSGSGIAATVSVGGGNANVSLTILAASPGIYGAQGSDGVVRATLARQDGSFVSLLNPARRGETVTAYVTGLGPTTPAVSTNQVPPRGTTATVNGTVVPGLAGGGATLNYARLTSDLVGVYEVSFVVPTTVTPGNNVGFSIGMIPVGASSAQYSNLIFVPVQ
jgi:uncharacterized protein (TIGR03437 family)